MQKFLPPNEKKFFKKSHQKKISAPQTKTIALLKNSG